MRKKLVAGNWKMNGSFSANKALLEGILGGLSGIECEVLVCVPYPYLAQAGEILCGTSVLLGAQNVSEHPIGAFTGEVSAAMLAEFGCKYALVGHSERRTLFAESDKVIADKCAELLVAGLLPVLCVGETLAERESGQTQSVISRQLAVVLDRVGVAGLAGAVVAYEPVWAIGTGVTATPQQAQEVHSAIRRQVSELDLVVGSGLRIVYGGSVKPQSAVDLFAQPDIDGGLVGGAALVVDDFLAICRTAN